MEIARLVIKLVKVNPKLDKETEQPSPLSSIITYSTCKYSAPSTKPYRRYAARTNARPRRASPRRASPRRSLYSLNSSDAQAIIFQQQQQHRYLVGIRYQSYIPLARSAFQ
jgi:hypothetical protein